MHHPQCIKCNITGTEVMTQWSIMPYGQDQFSTDTDVTISSSSLFQGSESTT